MQSNVQVAVMPRLGSARRTVGVRRFLARLELLIGFLSLGLATLLFRIESKRLSRTGSADQALKLLSLMMAGALAMLIARRPEMPAPHPG
jgi:hypothetical protein